MESSSALEAVETASLGTTLAVGAILVATAYGAWNLFRGKGMLSGKEGKWL